MSDKLLSVVTPAYNEAENLPHLHAKLEELFRVLGINWEWIIVDDHSGDRTRHVIAEIAAGNRHVRGVRLSRNFGSHAALYCGLSLCRGDAAVTLSADMQDPPEVVADMLQHWRGGSHVVWARRKERLGDNVSTKTFSAFYHRLVKLIVGNKDMPSDGIDYFLLDRRVIDALKEFKESNFSLFALVAWMGFRQATVEYVRQPRFAGKSGWTLRKKLTLVLDTLISFSMLPIRIAALVGMLISTLGLLYIPVLLFNWWFGTPPSGWTALMVIVLILGGMQMVQSSVSGEYIWRALSEARRRPRYIIEESFGPGDGAETPDGHDSKS